MVSPRIPGRTNPNSFEPDLAEPNLIDRAGTGGYAWDSWPELRQLPEVDPRTWPSVAVVAAHPDDEILGVGGILAILAAAGARVRCIR